MYREFEEFRGNHEMEQYWKEGTISKFLFITKAQTTERMVEEFEGLRFLIETLEPQAEDSYFAWNFFDPILGQKEGFSGYAFEDIAADYLKSHPDVKSKLEERRATDTAFAKSASQQLNFVYQNSSYFETNFLKYPVNRVR